MGQVSFDQKSDVVSEKPFGEPTAQLIDQEVRSLIDAAFQRTLRLVTENKNMVERVSSTIAVSRVVKKTKTLTKGQDPTPNQMTEVCDVAMIHTSIAMSPVYTEHNAN